MLPIRFQIIVFILTGGILALVSACHLSNKLEDDKTFEVADTASIGKIFIADMNKNSITLTRKNQQWMVNGEYPAREDAIKLLLATIHDIRMNHPVPKISHNAVIRNMASEAIKVEIYDRQNVLIKDYYIGSPIEGYRGNYFLMNGSKQPYVVDIPGFEGYVSVRYYTKVNDWRSRAIFNYKVSDISQIEVKYLDQNQKFSFQIAQVNPDSFRLSFSGKVDQKQAFKYFEFFKNVNSVAYANEKLPGMDTIKRRPAFCTIEVVDFEGKRKKVELVHMLTNKRSKYQMDITGKEVIYDIDNYYAWINDHRDFVQVQDFMFRKLMVKPSYFIYQPHP